MTTADRSQVAGSAASDPDLDQLVSDAVERARAASAEFASPRNRAQASQQELDGSSLPDERQWARRLAAEAEEFPEQERLPWTGQHDLRQIVLGVPEGRVTLTMLV